jgi:copper(I)-binding protein
MGEGDSERRHRWCGVYDDYQQGATPDKIICISDDASTQCQIHTMTMEGGVMKMQPVEGGLEIKPGESVTAIM